MIEWCSFPFRIKRGLLNILPESVWVRNAAVMDNLVANIAQRLNKNYAFRVSLYINIESFPEFDPHASELTIILTVTAVILLPVTEVLCSTCHLLQGVR